MAGIELGFLAPHPWIMAAGEREAGEAAELPVRFEAKPEALDHGSMVPILYLNPEGRLPVLLLSAEEGLRPLSSATRGSSASARPSCGSSPPPERSSALFRKAQPKKPAPKREPVFLVKSGKFNPLRRCCGQPRPPARGRSETRARACPPAAREYPPVQRSRARRPARRAGAGW